MVLIPENANRKLDSLGRITLPKGLRNRFNLEDGTELELYTAMIDGRMCICMTKPQTLDELETKCAAAIDLLEQHGFKVEGKLI